VSEQENMTICATMHCYNWAAKPDNPADPGFCDECKEKAKERTKNRPENAER
jgi:hypothetical protein